MSSPQRIVSLVPSQTELLYDLGLRDEVVGITKFCIHPPEWFRTKTRVGGTKNVHPDIVRSLNPDLIIANKEENVKEQVEALEAVAPVFVSDIHNLAGALKMIERVGELTGRSRQATALVANIHQGFDELRALPDPVHLMPCAYFIWKDPWMVAGADTFISDMLERAGLTNFFGHMNRYPTVDLQSLATSGCRVVLLSSEPYPFKEKHITEIRGVLPHAKIALVDGEMFSWYGSRLQYAPAYFQKLREELG